MDGSALARERGIGPARAARIGAALALGRRALQAGATADPVTTPARAGELLAPGLLALGHEELHALFLDRRRAPLGLRVISRGSDAFTIVDGRQIYRQAVHLGAAALILAHNHPSGDPTPSVQDRQVTDSVARAGSILGIPLLDHLIVGHQRVVSLAEEGLLPRWAEGPPAWTA
jgi:DNA repair protein RadC